LPTGDVRMVSLIFKPETFDPFITGRDEDLTEGRVYILVLKCH